MNIHCAICRKPVDRIDTWFDQRRDAHLIRVFCHGDVDQMELTALQIVSMDRMTLQEMLSQEGLAFTNKRIKQEAA